jgi:hypothetical protein
MRLVRAYDGAVMTLAEAPLDWTFDAPYAFDAQVVGDAVTVAIGATKLQVCDRSAQALADGGVALIINEGACSCDEVRVTAPRLIAASSVDFGSNATTT